VIVTALAAGCTGDGDGDATRTPTGTTTSPPPTGPVHYLPGEYRYEFGGVTATLSFDAGGATMDVKNATGAELDTPGLYVVMGTGDRVDGTVGDASPIADGDSARFQVTFPAQVTPKSIGLVALLFGNANWGLFAPVPAA
jgi:hypothetical protein